MCTFLIPDTYTEVTYPDVDHGISSITLQRVQLQVPLEVPGVQPRDGKAVPVTSLDKKKCSGLKLPGYKPQHVHLEMLSHDLWKEASWSLVYLFIDVTISIWAAQASVI